LVSSVSGVNLLTANGAGMLSVDNTISASSLNDSEATTLNGTGGSETITTTAGQCYTGALTLGANTTLTGTTLALAAVTGGGYSLTLDNSGLATLGSAVSGVNVLTADETGTLTVGNTVSAASLNDSETTTLNGTAGVETITTSGAQAYYSSVTQGADANLTGSTLTLGPSWNAAWHSLGLTFTGAVTVPAVFTNVNNFASNGSGGTLVNGTFSTAGNQTYNNAVTLSAAADALTSTAAGSVTFGSTLDATPKNTDSLTVNAGSVSFLGRVGGIAPLDNLTITDSSNPNKLLDSVTAAVGITATQNTTVTAGAGNYAITLGTAVTPSAIGGELTVDLSNSIAGQPNTLKMTNILVNGVPSTQSTSISAVNIYGGSGCDTVTLNGVTTGVWSTPGTFIQYVKDGKVGNPPVYMASRPGGSNVTINNCAADYLYLELGKGGDTLSMGENGPNTIRQRAYVFCDGFPGGAPRGKPDTSVSTLNWKWTPWGSDLLYVFLGYGTANVGSQAAPCVGDYTVLVGGASKGNIYLAASQAWSTWVQPGTGTYSIVSSLNGSNRRHAGRRELCDRVLDSIFRLP
jgi:hypothetical protein